jgi:hypothetical protein
MEDEAGGEDGCLAGAGRVLYSFADMELKAAEVSGRIECVH